MMRSPMLGAVVAYAVLGAAIAGANNTNANSDIIDTADCEGVIFIATLGNSTTAGVARLLVEQNDADSGTGMAALAGAMAEVTSADTNDLANQVLIVDVYQPRERYLRAVRQTATQNVAFGSLIAIKYGTRKAPIALADSGAAAITSVASPPEAA